MIERVITHHIQRAARKYPILSITGPRQSGKTVLAKSVFSTYAYFNLENPATRSFAHNDPQGFLAQDTHMIIDEIHHAPDLFSFMQVLVDEQVRKKFIITGSQNFLISESISQSLAGRVAIFKLFPLSMVELKKATLLKGNVLEQIFTGFYPRIYADRLDPASWYDNYIQTYLERDVRQLKAIENLSVFQRFLALVAGRTGQILNMSSLAADTGISVTTVENWLSILEASFIIFKLPPYFANIHKRIIKAPKIHFYDSGLVCALLHINSVEQLGSHPLVGNIFESFVVSEYMKQSLNAATRPNMFYLREKTGKEVDLITQQGKQQQLIEIKFGQTFHEEFVANLQYVEALFKKPMKKNIVYGGDTSQKRSQYTVIGWKEIF